jgi:hypothetical protein
MRIHVGALKLAIAVIASGCAAVAPNKSVELSARDLGLAYHFPDANVKIRQTGPLTFVMRTYLGDYAAPGTGQDAMAWPYFGGLLVVCPIWSIAKAEGMPIAVIYKAVDGPKGEGEAHFTLVKSAPPAKEGESVLDFMGPEGVYARETLCDKTSELNRPWWGR